MPLRRSVLRVGGRGADVHVPELDGEPSGQLHVWSSPPKAVRVGGGPELFASGRRVDEVLLEPGVTAVWGPFEVSVGGAGPVLEELPPEPAARGDAARAAAAGGADSLGPNARRTYERMLAGLLVELGIADKQAAKRWQAAVVQGEWDADACAREVIDRTAPSFEDPRLVERAGRLQRDLVMASFQRGLRKASRSVRGAARHGSAFLLANFLAIFCYSIIIVAIAVLLRVKWEWSFDGLIDRALSVF